MSFARAAITAAAGACAGVWAAAACAQQPAPGLSTPATRQDAQDTRQQQIAPGGAGRDAAPEPPRRGI